MSYTLRNPEQYVVGLLPAVQPHNYPLVPLSQDAVVTASSADEQRKKMILIALAIVAVVAILWMMNRKPARAPMTRNKVVKKLSTPELAKNLYERLEKRGNANETVMRSLKTYATQAKS
jgi:hypothetical protein